MNVVYAVTANFLEKIIPSMRSLIKHNPKAKVYVLTEVDEMPIETPCPVTVVNVSGQKYFGEDCVNLRNNFGGAINLLKVAYPELLPRLNKALHLDADTIVCEDLTQLWKTDLTGKWFAAVQEYKGQYKPFGEAYYNAGVLLVNLAQMRKDSIVPEMVDYLNTVRQPFADQDAWNYYGIQDDKAVALPVRYNENFATGKTDTPAIVHFCGVRDWWDRKSERSRYLDEYK